MKTLYFDIISGISGDMSLSALLQFGIDIKKLNSHLSLLLNGTVCLSLLDKKINGIATKQLSIKTENCKTPHRNLNSISNILENSDLPEKVIIDSVNIFKIIADSESKMHMQAKDKVHFHEVGAIDSIIDIVGISYCINEIKPDYILSSPVVIGNGIVNTAHGLLPVPAPATSDILKEIPIKRININSELTTPTGAAIIKYFTNNFTNEFSGEIADISYSTGTKEFENYPNMLRLFLVENKMESTKDIFIMETNIDDDTGENLGNLIDLLFKNNAIDVFFTPIFGKKNRPANMITIMCNFEQIDTLSKIIFKYSSTAGLRYYPVKRNVMTRKFEKIKYKNNVINIKILSYENIKKYIPEWKDIVNASEDTNEPPMQIYNASIGIIRGKNENK